MLINVFVVEVTLRFLAFESILSKTLLILDFVVVYVSLIIDVVDKTNGESSNDSCTIGIEAFRLLRFVRAIATFN